MLIKSETRPGRGEEEAQYKGGESKRKGTVVYVQQEARIFMFRYATKSECDVMRGRTKQLNDRVPCVERR